MAWARAKRLTGATGPLRKYGGLYLFGFFLPGWSRLTLTLSGPREEDAHFLWKCWLGMILLCFTILANRRNYERLSGAERLLALL